MVSYFILHCSYFFFNPVRIEALDPACLPADPTLSLSFSYDPITFTCLISICTNPILPMWDSKVEKIKFKVFFFIREVIAYLHWGSRKGKNLNAAFAWCSEAVWRETIGGSILLLWLLDSYSQAAKINGSVTLCQNTFQVTVLLKERWYMSRRKNMLKCGRKSKFFNRKSEQRNVFPPWRQGLWSIQKTTQREKEKRKKKKRISKPKICDLRQGLCYPEVLIFVQNNESFLHQKILCPLCFLK